MSLLDQYDDLAQCNKCGFCQVACPIFRATGHESGVARGRLALLRGIIEERVDWTRDLEEPLFNCLRCGACTSNCFPGIATADLLAGARAEYLDRLGRSPVLRWLFDELLPHPGRLHLAAKAAALGKNTGLTKAVRALGMLRGFGNLARAEGIVERLPAQPYRSAGLPRVVDGAGELRIGYFVGCGNDVLCPETAAATVTCLRQIGRTVHVLDNCCCGMPASTYGDADAARRLAERNLATLDPSEFDAIVTDCSSCAAFLKKYPDLFAADHPRRQAAETFASVVRDAVEVLRQAVPDAGNEDAARNSTPSNVWNCARSAVVEGAVVTYHDPCHAVRGQGLSDEPREVLRSLPGVEYRELPEADWCCGGAGAYALSHYDLSMKVLDRKMDNVAKTGADTLVTSCPACMIQLRHGVRRQGLQVRVKHLSELVGGSAAASA